MNTTYTLHFFKEGISFPVMLVAADEWERKQISYLYTSKRKYGMTTLQICGWCENHSIRYGVIFPKHFLMLGFTDIKRLLCYVVLKCQGVSSISI